MGETPRTPLLPAERGDTAASSRARSPRHGLARMSVLAGWLLAWAACLCLASPAHAEIPTSWFGKPIEAIEIVGEASARLSPRDVGVPLGVPLTRSLVRRAVRKLAMTGLYRNVQLDARRTGRGVTLLVRLAPRFVALRIDVVGNSQLSDRELLRPLEVRQGGEVEREYLPEISREMQARYAEIGYRDADVAVQLRDTDDPTQKVLRIEVDEGPPTLIETYTFLGDPLPERKGLRRTLKLNRGQPLAEETLQQTLQQVAARLRDAGYYEARFGTPEVRIHERSAEVRVPSHVGPRYRVEIRGQEPLDRGDVFDVLELTGEPLPPDGPFGSMEARVVELYRKLGYPKAEVRLRRDPPNPAACPQEDTRNRARSLRFSPRDDSPGDSCREALFRVAIDKGPQLEVDRVRFVGARHFEQEFLREQLFSYLDEDLPASVVGQPVDPVVADRLGFGGSKDERPREGDPPPIADPRRLYYGPTYDEAVDHIRDLYRADGFLSVKITEAEMRPVQGSDDEVEAIFSVEEGPRTYIFDVRVAGNVQVTSYALLAEIQLETAQPFSYLALEEARLRALDAYRERGFFYAKVEPDVRFSDDGTRAEIVFEVVERYVVRVGEIEIRGADRSRESMIRNRLALGPGDLYRPSAARESEERILGLDVFMSVTVAPDEADLPARVKTLVVRVTERKSQWLGWSGGFSTGEGVRGGVEYGYRNLFGAAIRTTLRGQIGYQIVFLDEQIRDNYSKLSPDERIEYQVNASIGLPYIPNAPRIGTSLDFVVMQDLQRDFRMQKESLTASLYFRPAKRLVLTFAEELEQSFFQLLNLETDNIGNLPITELVPFGENTLLSTHVSAAWDLRDRAFNPRKGALFSVTTQWAKTLRDQTETVDGATGSATEVTFKSNMLRFSATGAFYVPLGEKLVFATQMRWGRVVHLEEGSDSYPNRRFYLGGINFRGYRQYEMVPQDLEDAPDYSLPDVVSRGGETFVAAQNELRFPLFGQFWGGLFADVGNLWADPKEINFRELEVTVGAGIRLRTPVASLAFDYGVRQIALGPFEMRGAFQFAFQRF